MAFSSSSDNDDVLSEINITPLVDVMLVLLVAFIVTAPLLNNAVHVNLPNTVATAPADRKPNVTVSVDDKGVVSRQAGGRARRRAGRAGRAEGRPARRRARPAG